MELPNMIWGQRSDSGLFSFYNNQNTTYTVRFLFNQDINSDGIDEVFVAGFETQPNTPSQYDNTTVHMFGWVNGQFKEITSRWLPGSNSQIQGTGDITFGDFNGDGKKDFFTTAYTDMDYAVNSYAFINRGDHFDKINLGTASWQHGATSADINKDGYSDVMTSGYGSSGPALYMGSAGGLTKYTFKNYAGGSGITFGDFLNNRTTTVILTDHHDTGPADTKMFSVTFDPLTKLADLTYISTLPTPRLESSGSDNNSHDVAAYTFDFNHDHVDDVLVFSRANFNGTVWPNQSSIQFLQNDGHGNFTDVTSKLLIGYDSNSSVTYNPTFADFNGDNLTDIFLSGPTFDTRHSNSTTILMQQPDGTFVDAQRMNLSGMIDMNNGFSGGYATMAKGPGGDWFFVGDHPNESWVNPIAQDSLYAYHVAFTFDNTGGPRSTVTWDHNTPHFSGHIAEYSWETVGNNLLVKGYDVRVEVQNPDRLVFADYNVAFEEHGNAGEAYRLYKAAFDREPDLEGLGYWINSLDHNTPLSDVASCFVNSDEFHKLYGANTTTQEFVTHLYNNVLDRDPEAGGFNYWCNELDQHHQTREQVLVGFSESIENQHNVVDLIGNGIMYDPWFMM